MRKMIFVALLTVIATPVFAQEATINAYIELLRQDVRTERIAIIEEVMEFTEEEAEAFWPVYKKYEQDIRKLNDQRLELIKEFAASYSEMTDETAGQLVKRSLELNVKEAHLRKDYFRKFDRVLPTKRAARFMQLERQINLLIDIQIATELPLID